MRIIAALWRQFKALITFFLLEGIALYMIFACNPYQNTTFFNTFSGIRNNLFDSFSLIDNYFYLQMENTQLMKENAALSQQLFNGQQERGTSSTDTTEGTYSMMPAKVLHSSVQLPDNYLIINKGREDGVSVDMAVTSSKGLVGVVYAVTQDYASVMPIINSSFSCLVSFENYTLSANTAWNGLDYRYVQVKEVPLHLNIKKGDAVFTNNNSLLYPNDEPIGRVTEIVKDNLGKSYTLNVELATDFSKLKHVYVIANKKRVQIDSLIANE